MCVVYLAYKQHKEIPLLILSNRDEFYNRPTEPAHYWSKNSKILGGQDIEAKGTWLACRQDGAWAIITNYRDPNWQVKMPRSRGLLVRDYIESYDKPENFLKYLKKDKYSYLGYNLLFGKLTDIYYYNNKEKESQKLEPALYGLSNHLLDTPWPKVLDGKRELENILKEEKFIKGGTLDPAPFFSFLQNSELAEDNRLPQTGVSLEWERVLSSRFIRSKEYGTRTSTLIWLDLEQNLNFLELNYDREGQSLEEHAFSYKVPS